MTNIKVQISKESGKYQMTKYDLRERAIDLAVRAAKFISAIPQDRVSNEYSKQLIRSSSSIGANIEEADGTLTKKDFINKMAIARREARESLYWLQLIKRTANLNDPRFILDITWLLKESNELLLILSSIINKVRLKQ